MSRHRNRCPRIAQRRPSQQPDALGMVLMSLGVAVGGAALIGIAFHMRHALYAAIDYAAWVVAVYAALVS
jgi:hypothetical protein